MKLITNAVLIGACKEQRAIFRKEWPEGAPVTAKAAMRGLSRQESCNPGSSRYCCPRHQIRRIEAASL